MIRTYSFSSVSIGAPVLRALLCAVLAAGGPAWAATFTVSNANDSGAGSLRQAIIDANASPTADTINFSADFVINLQDHLPALTTGGTTITGGTRNIIINGGGNHVFFANEVNSVTLRNMTIANGIYAAHLRGGTNHIVENLGISGTTYPVYIHNNASGVVVRGCAISGNPRGVTIDNASNNTIGGVLASQRNVIGGNSGSGVIITGTGATGNAVVGNWIGLDALGLSADPNQRGIQIANAPNNTIGGVITGARNVISGNLIYGVQIDGINATGTQILGNYFGTNRFGTSAVPNSAAGVGIIGAPGTQIGDGTPGGTNLMRFGTWGVVALGPLAIGNTISRNAIFGNVDSGIFLSGGANNGIEPPVILTAAPAGGTVPTSGVVELYVDDGNQGELFVDAVNSIVGVFQSSVDLSPFEGQNLTATLTDGDGNTSAFSAPFLIDVTPPTGSIEILDAFTTDEFVELELTASDNFSTAAEIEMRFSNNGGVNWSAWEPFDTERAWDLSEGIPELEDGIRTVSVQFRDAALNVSAAFEDTVLLDTTGPEIVSFVLLDDSPTLEQEVRFQIAFNELVDNLTTGTVPPFDDFAIHIEEVNKTITGAEVVAVEDEGANTFTITVDIGAGEGLIFLDVVEDGGLTDQYGNPFEGPVRSPEGYVITRLAISEHPEGGEVIEGDSFGFSAAATGGLGALSYGWYRDGFPLPDTDSPALNLEELTIPESGLYWMEVSDLYVTVESDPAFLDVLPRIPAHSLFGLTALAALLSGLALWALRGARRPAGLRRR